MMKFLSFVFTFILFCCININNANAFFTDDYKQNTLYGAFKQVNNADIYLGLNVGFMAKTWTPNISTMLTPNSEEIAHYNDVLADQMFLKTSDYYTYYIGIIFGLHHQNSRIRHEIEFDWYGIISKPIKITGDDMLTKTIDDVAYNYKVLDNNQVISLGIYSNIYRLMYNIYVGMDNVFTFLNVKWDIFFGIGAGFAITSGGTYAGEQITNKSNGSEENANANENKNDYEYKNNDISTAATVGESKLFSSTNFGIAYQTKVGVLSNISQSFGLSISLVFGATSRPLLTTKFKYIDKIEGSNTHLEYHIGIEIGVLLKAFELAI